MVAFGATDASSNTFGRHYHMAVIALQPGLIGRAPDIS